MGRREVGGGSPLELSVRGELANRRHRIGVGPELAFVGGLTPGRIGEPPRSLERDAVVVVEVDRTHEAVIDHFGDLDVVLGEPRREGIEGRLVGQRERHMVELGGKVGRKAGRLLEREVLIALPFEERERAPVADLKEVVPHAADRERGHQPHAEDAVVKPDRRVHIGGDEGQVVHTPPARLRRHGPTLPSRTGAGDPPGITTAKSNNANKEANVQEAVWDPPGAGFWRIEASHCLGAMTPIGQHLMERGLRPGMATVFRLYGVPAETLDPRFVNGRLYTRLRPLIAPDKPATKLPPPPLLKLAVRLHPEFRRRKKNDAHTLRTQPWRRTVRDMDE